MCVKVPEDLLSISPSGLPSKSVALFSLGKTWTGIMASCTAARTGLSFWFPIHCILSILVRLDPLHAENKSALVQRCTASFANVDILPMYFPYTLMLSDALWATDASRHEITWPCCSLMSLNKVSCPDLSTVTAQGVCARADVCQYVATLSIFVLKILKSLTRPQMRALEVAPWCLSAGPAWKHNRVFLLPGTKTDTDRHFDAVLWRTRTMGIHEETMGNTWT